MVACLRPNPVYCDCGIVTNRFALHTSGNQPGVRPNHGLPVKQGMGARD